MELTVPPEGFVEDRRPHAGRRGRKSTMPVLANVLPIVRGGQKRLPRRDGPVPVAHGPGIPAEIAKGGSVAVSGRDLFERVKMMPDGPIVITSTDNATTTPQGRGYRRRLHPPRHAGRRFPPLPSPPMAPSLALEVEVLQSSSPRLISRSRPTRRARTWNSALFEWDGDTVRMVTTDGHRLSKVDVKVPGHCDDAHSAGPSRSFAAFATRCRRGAHGAERQGRGQEAQITQSGIGVLFQALAPRVSVKLVDAQFPPYSQVIPAEQ